MTYKLSKGMNGDPFGKSAALGLYRVQEDEEVSTEEGGGATKEYIHRIRLEQDDGDIGDPDVMFEYKAYQDQSFFERSQKAKRIRQQQLEDWHRREAQSDTDPHRDGLAQSGSQRRRKQQEKKKTVMFEWNVLLMDAVLRNEIVEVERLLSTYETLEQSPRMELVNCRSPDGLTPLHQCCIENLEAMASLLIKHGADLRAADSELWTPLHAAATCGHLSVVRILIAAAKSQQSLSSDIVRDMLLAVNSDGNMPFDLCDNAETLVCVEHEMQLRGISQDDIEAKRHKKEVDMLRDLQQYIDSHLNRAGSLRRRSSGPKYDYHEMWDKFIAASQIPNSLTMHIAAANGYMEVMDLLLRNKFPVDLEDLDGWLPIHAAVAWNQPEAAKRLVEAGADITAKVRGTNETAVDLAATGDLAEDVGKGERFRDQLIVWDASYKAKCEEEARKSRHELPRHPSSESITSAPSSSSPLLRRSSPRLARVQRRSSLKDKEDLIALLHTLGAHDLKSPENNQTTVAKFTRSPGGSLRDRNPTLPNVPEETVSSTAIVHIAGPLDVDLIDQTISSELISSLLRTFDDQPDDDTESVAEQLMRTAEDSLNQIDQPVTLSQLKHRRNKFRLHRKEKPFVPRELLKNNKNADTTGLLIDDSSQERTQSCLPIGTTSKSESVMIREVNHANGGVGDSVELQKFKATQDERPVGGSEFSSDAKLERFKSKKRDKLNFHIFGKKDKEPASDDSHRTWSTRVPQSNGCCTIT